MSKPVKHSTDKGFMSSLAHSVTVQEGVLSHLDACFVAVRDSDLGNTYFTEEANLLNFLRDGLVKGEIRVALAEDGECLGFIWFSGSGMFYRFPYIRLIGVSRSSRSSGVGTLLLNYAEDLFRERKLERSFLTVGDFNHRARLLYERLGYAEIAVIPDLFYPGHAEHVMMKLLACD
jgi:ribosomal protein S18 acetylase RimI-like enzyme